MAVNKIYPTPQAALAGGYTRPILDANSGGFWGMQFKKAGYDVMIIRGKAEKPLWIEIKNDEWTSVKWTADTIRKVVMKKV